MSWYEWLVYVKKINIPTLFYMKRTHIIFLFLFFLTSKGHFITQARGGLGNQTGIEQPIKYNSLWKDLAVFAKKSEI